MHKKKLLIIIDNLKKGGAEVLLVGILPELNRKYDVVLVTLTKECDFPTEQIACIEKFSLGFTGKLSFLLAVLQLKKIIKTTAPDFIHSHLFYSSLAARLACPATIPLFYSVHNEMSKNVFNSNTIYKWLEKLSIRKNHSIIAVSKLVFEDYVNTIQTTKQHFILRNYIADEYFQAPETGMVARDTRELRLIAVGNLKESKNYEYLVHSFIQLKDHPISLDIYGNTVYTGYAYFLELIRKYDLKVNFKGKVSNVKDLYSLYDVYIMSSKYEGFGIAAIEAMAMGLPVLLSDIPVLREVSFNNALFFDVEDSECLPSLLLDILKGKHDLSTLSQHGVEVAQQYTKTKYLEELYYIYDTISLPGTRL